MTEIGRPDPNEPDIEIQPLTTPVPERIDVPERTPAREPEQVPA